MSKKEGKGLKSFNKGFQVPDTYIIIFLVVVACATKPPGFWQKVRTLFFQGFG